MTVVNGSEEQGSLQRQSYLRIREMVMNGELAPGDAVVERQLARELGVSRIPVREALVELEKDGLIQRAGSRARIVTEMTLNDVLEIYELREMVECMAARLSAERMSDESLAELREMADFLDSGAASVPEDLAFHDKMVQECGNGRLIEIASPIRFHSEKVHYRTMMIERRVRMPDTQAEPRYPHGLVADAVASRDPDRAETAARGHVWEARGYLMYVFSRTRTI